MNAPFDQSRGVRRAALLLGAAGMLAPLARAQGIVDLGLLPGGTWSYSSAISDDGSVVVGSGQSADGTSRAWRWTAATGLVSLGTAPGMTRSSAYRISGDGLVVTGVSGSAYDIAARWTAQSGMVSLGSMAPGKPSFAFGTNLDGSVVVGDGYLTDGSQRAFRWSAAGGMVQFGQRLAGCNNSLALLMGGDASVIAGYCFNNAPALVYPTACVWDSSGAVMSLGVLPGKQESVPGAISADGSVIVGYCADGTGQNTRGFLWTASAGMQEITLGSLGTVLGSVNADGSIVTGRYMDTPSTVRGLIWTASGGAQDVEAYLNAQGVSTAGWNIRTAGISADGSTLYGWGVHDGKATTWYLSQECIPPGVVSGPSSQSVDEGMPVSFAVQASGTSVQYQWYKDNLAIGGATGGVYSIPAVTAQDAGVYRCDLSNACGTASSQEAVLTVTSGCETPSVDQGPSDVSNCPGATAAFAVQASGTGPPDYEWRHDGEPLIDGWVEGHAEVSGARTDTLTLRGVRGADAGVYECGVTNDCGTSWSSSASLWVCGADVDCSGFVDTEDFDEFVVGFEAGDDDADFDGSGFVDTEDFDAFVRAFEAGC